MPDEVHVHQQPTGPTSDGGGPGWIIALVVVVLLVAVVWFGFMRGETRRGVPEQVDIDINLPEGSPTRPDGGGGGGTGGGGTGGGGTGGGAMF
jgi:hypothetical protein